MDAQKCGAAGCDRLFMEGNLTACPEGVKGGEFRRILGVWMNRIQRLRRAIENTHVVRLPKQMLATFGSTSVRYYLVTVPSYQDLDIPQGEEESVVREGVVRAERPQVVTPYYLMRHEGFGDHADQYLQHLVDEYGPNLPGLMYRYKNEGAETAVIAGSVAEVTEKIVARLDKEQKPLEAVINGEDDLWDVSLMKFIYEFTNHSARSNVSEMQGAGPADDGRGSAKGRTAAYRLDDRRGPSREHGPGRSSSRD